MSRHHCPYCKNQLEIRADTKITIYKYGGLGVERLFGRKQRPMGLMESKRPLQSDVAALPQPKPTGFTREPAIIQSGAISARRESADYMPTRESHVDVPWQQAIRNGFLWGAFILVIGAIIWMMISIAGDIWDIHQLEYQLGRIGWFKLTLAGLLTSIVVMLWVAKHDFGIQVENYSEAIHRVEEFVRRDIDGDGYVGEPEETHLEVNLPAPRGGKRKAYADLPGNHRKLVGFAWAVLHPNYAVNFSFYGADKTGYGKNAFGKLRDIFIEREWAFVKDPSIQNSELVLTGDGKQILYRLAQEAPEDLPEVDLSGPEPPEHQFKRFSEIDY